MNPCWSYAVVTIKPSVATAEAEEEACGKTTGDKVDDTIGDVICSINISIPQSEEHGKARVAHSQMPH